MCVPSAASNATSESDLDFQQRCARWRSRLSIAPPASCEGERDDQFQQTRAAALAVVVLAAPVAGAQTTNAPSDEVRTVVGRLELERFKAHVKGLTQFGDRMVGTQRNRDAIDWLDRQLRSFGYSNVERHRFISA